MRFLLMIGLVGSLAVPGLAQPSGQFQTLGKAVNAGRLHGATVVSAETGKLNWYYQCYGQAGAGDAFLLAVDPGTGRCRQFTMPEGLSARGGKTVRAHDGVVYMGTYNPALLVRFGPRRPKAGLVQCGRRDLSPGSFVQQILPGADGKLYLTTLGQDCHLFRYDPGADCIEDLGALSPGNSYALAADFSADRNTLCVAVCPTPANVVAYDIRTGKKKPLIPESLRAKGLMNVRGGSYVEHVMEAKNKNVEVRGGPLVDGGAYLMPMREEYAIFAARDKLAPGGGNREFDSGGRAVHSTPDFLKIETANGRKKTIPLEYAAAAQLSTIWTRPDGGKVWMSSSGPLNVAEYDPATSKFTVHECPTVMSRGNIRSIGCESRCICGRGLSFPTARVAGESNRHR
jgi:hypothetical protein